MQAFCTIAEYMYQFFFRENFYFLQIKKKTTYWFYLDAHHFVIESMAVKYVWDFHSTLWLVRNVSKSLMMMRK